jgi:hypothetical protein
LKTQLKWTKAMAGQRVNTTSPSRRISSPRGSGKVGGRGGVEIHKGVELAGLDLEG